MARRPLVPRSPAVVEETYPDDDDGDRITVAIAEVMDRIASLPLRDARARRARQGLRRLRQWASTHGHGLGQE
jgi:hypothetical protein